jgi:hypothetical protein
MKSRFAKLFPHAKIPRNCNSNVQMINALHKVLDKTPIVHEKPCIFALKLSGIEFAHVQCSGTYLRLHNKLEIIPLMYTGHFCHTIVIDSVPLQIANYVLHESMTNLQPVKYMYYQEYLVHRVLSGVINFVMAEDIIANEVLGDMKIPRIKHEIGYEYKIHNK